MKSLHTLIKKTDLEINEQKIIMVQLEERKEYYEQQLQKLRSDLENENRFVDQNPELAYTIEQYNYKNKENQKKVIKQIENINKEIDKVQNIIRDIFAEQKRYEISLDMKMQQKLQEEKKSEISELDEVANTAFLEEMRQKDTYE